MRTVLLGATRGMGRALARQMAERGDALFLLGRDPTELERSAADLEIRGAPGKVGFARCDLRERTAFGPALDAATTELGGCDTVVVSAGQFAPQQELERDADLRDELLRVNFVNTVHFCEEARTRLLAAGGGTLVVFSSVAGDRARRSVGIYGASKAGLSHYITGLDYGFRRAGLRSLLVKPGFVSTGTTSDQDPPRFAGEPERVARDVLRAIDRGRPLLYTPRIWRAVMWMIRSLPRSLMRRSEF